MTADVVGLYPNIPHNPGLKALSNMLEAREQKAVSTDDLVKMAHFVLENNYFEFNGDVKKQISGTAISLFREEISACAAVHKRYVMDACDRVRPIILLLPMMGTSFVLVALTRLIVSKPKHRLT